MSKCYTIEYTKRSKQDLRTLAKNDQKFILKFEKLIKEIIKNPRQGLGKPECLRHCQIETWSRQISHKHRLVYEIYEERICIIILSAANHYNDH